MKKCLIQTSSLVYGTFWQTTVRLNGPHPSPSHTSYSPSAAATMTVLSTQRISFPTNANRVARSFYFLRRCVLAQSHPSMQPKCRQDLDCIGVTELYILWEMLHWLCGSLGWEQQEELGIWYEASDSVLGISTTTMPDWKQARDMVVDAYCAKRHLGEDGYETRLYGPCDRCNKETSGSDLPVRRCSDP